MLGTGSGHKQSNMNLIQHMTSSMHLGVGEHKREPSREMSALMPGNWLQDQEVDDGITREWCLRFNPALRAYAKYAFDIDVDLESEDLNCSRLHKWYAAQTIQLAFLHHLQKRKKKQLEKEAKALEDGKLDPSNLINNASTHIPGPISVSDAKSPDQKVEEVKEAPKLSLFTAPDAPAKKLSIVTAPEVEVKTPQQQPVTVQEDVPVFDPATHVDEPAPAAAPSHQRAPSQLKEEKVQEPQPEVKEYKAPDAVPSFQINIQGPSNEEIQSPKSVDLEAELAAELDSTLVASPSAAHELQSPPPEQAISPSAESQAAAPLLMEQEEKASELDSPSPSVPDQ
jgi:hypothetical protein